MASPAIELNPLGKPYSASLSKSQGRTGWSVIFRHPARREEATGKFGVRVRRGLGTRDDTEAESLRVQLDQLLADTKFHDVASREEALRRFDPRVVDIFFDKIIPEETDFRTLRNEMIRLPTADEDGYRRVLLLGTTGAGKTTLARQLIGTDPATERFPSTSTAKTTVHDTEIIIANGPWRAIVTFAPLEEVREYLNECASAAALAAWRGATDGEIQRRLLNHVNQRFRFSYVLGNGPAAQTSDFADDDEDLSIAADDVLTSVDLADTNALLREAVATLKEIAQRHAAEIAEMLQATTEADERVIDELMEEELDNLIRDDERFHRLSDDLLNEVERRFDFLTVGELRRTKQSWPISWYWETSDRKSFLQAVARFSSNYAQYFGQLLTPLVNGIRVSGPFKPKWLDQCPKLAILDGEGLGHTPQTSATVSTNVVRRIEEVDAVLLVDNAAQPMLAAPTAAMRELVSTGNGSKLIFAFTHFDEVKGDNLLTPTSKVHHVLASAENVLKSIGEDLGPFAERAIRNRLENARVFLADVDEPLSPQSKSGTRTIVQFEKLLGYIEDVIVRPEHADSKPRYNRMNLVLAVKSAAENFHAAWFARLGLEARSGSGKEHWTRIKALSRRLATGMADHYDTLHPVADLRKELQDRIYVLIQNPIGWTATEPEDDQKQLIFDALAEAIAGRMLTLSTERVWKEKSQQWQAAYDKHGPGSTYTRAGIIGGQIFDPAAPIPDITPSIDRNQFLQAVADKMREAANEVGAELA
jgi:energy-coupling factor transporter ATP-binding protein EcfA2